MPQFAPKQPENAAPITQIPPRKVAEIQAEYEAAVAQLGEREYKRQVIEAEITALVRRCYELNQEADQAQKAAPAHVVTEEAGNE